MIDSQLVFMIEKDFYELNNGKASTIMERANLYGVQSLLDNEAISFLTGIRQDELKEYLNLHDLIEYHEGLQITHLQKQKLKAIFEIAVRFQKEDIRPVTKITSPTDVANLFMIDMMLLKKEYFKAVLLDGKNQLISVEQISEGILNSSLAHPREVFRPAINKAANTIILVHNHPSGDPEPSSDDIITTNRLIDVGKIIGINVSDHVIIGYNKYYSFKEENIID